MDKKKLSEADICLKFITPALAASGWDVNEQVFQEFTLKAGRMVDRDPRAARDCRTIRRADFMLCHRPGLPIAVIHVWVTSKESLDTLITGSLCIAYEERFGQLDAQDLSRYWLLSDHWRLDHSPLHGQPDGTLRHRDRAPHSGHRPRRQPASPNVPGRRPAFCTHTAGA